MTSQPFNQGGGDGSQGSPALSVLKRLERGQTNANRAGWQGIHSGLEGWRALAVAMVVLIASHLLALGSALQRLDVEDFPDRGGRRPSSPLSPEQEVEVR